MRTMAPVVVDDLARETRFRCPPLVDQGIVSALSVVIPLPGRVQVAYGTLVAASRARRAFHGEDVDFLQAASSVVGAAIHRRSADEQLRESEERFALLSEAMDDGALVPLTPEGSLAGWSAPAERLFGWRADAVIGRHLSTLAVEEDALHGRADELLRLAERDGHVDASGWAARSDGSRFRSAAELFALRSDHGALRGFAVIVRDVTARFEAEAERARLVAENDQQRRMLQAVLDQLPVGVRIYGAPSGRRLFHNAELEEIWPLSRTMSADRPEFWTEVQVQDAEGRWLTYETTPGRRALRGETVRQVLEVLAAGARVTSRSCSSRPRRCATRRVASWPR